MIVEVRVVANSANDSIEEFGRGYKVRVKEKPFGGKANEKVIEVVAAHFGVKRSKVRILRGATQKRKLLEVDAP